MNMSLEKLQTSQPKLSPSKGSLRNNNNTNSPSVKDMKPSQDRMKSAISDHAKPSNGTTEDNVTLIQENFAQYFDGDGEAHPIKRFTWKNRNKIQIQAINYGARVTSVKYPDRHGEIEDVLLGFDDLAGYLFYAGHRFGSIIGRVSNVAKNATFSIDDKRYTVRNNGGRQSVHGGGGEKSLDKIVWDTYVTGTKVIMSHISPHLTEGYPGDLLVRVTFDLSSGNEFRVNLEAQSTRPTCIDLSHLLYFNLAGHQCGPDETYRHILTLNCNCFTPQDEDASPTGQIMNVVHTRFDFQVPKVLGKAMGVDVKEGYDQNLCVNRGTAQNQCFVGRLVHPPSGRMLEVYSNQPGVQLKTANDFGSGIVDSSSSSAVAAAGEPEAATRPSKCQSTTIRPEATNSMVLFRKVHAKLVDLLKLDEPQNFRDILQLIETIAGLGSRQEKENATKEISAVLPVTPLQLDYLRSAKEIMCESEETDEECLDLKETLSVIIALAQPIEAETIAIADQSENTFAAAPAAAVPSAFESIAKVPTTAVSQSNEYVVKETSMSSVPSKQSKSNGDKKATEENVNQIPVYYEKSGGLIKGKGQSVYKTHAGVALQTQNYPNAINIKHFPSTTLNPGDVYRHEIVYRFWIRAGDPSKWIRRNANETKKSFNKTPIKGRT